MNKIIIIAAAAVFIPLAAACTNTQSAPSPTVTVTAEIPQSVDDGVSSTPRQDYTVILRATGNPYLLAASDSDLLDMGDTVCATYNSGLTTDDIITYMAQEMTRQGMTSDDEVEAVGYIIAAASEYLCPGQV